MKKAFQVELSNLFNLKNCRVKEIIKLTALFIVISSMFTSCAIVSGEFDNDTFLGNGAIFVQIIVGIFEGIFAPIVWFYYMVFWLLGDTDFFFKLFHFEYPVYSVIFLLGSLVWLAIIVVYVIDGIVNGFDYSESSESSGSTEYSDYGHTTTVSKKCENCGGIVSNNASVGDTCPHCGVIWGKENTKYHG